MCGIVGYIGDKKVVPVIIEGLRKLEYRGYDSAGIAVVGEDGKLHLRRAPGKLRNLEEVIKNSPIDGTYGIGHTRWATHGRPTEENAHPHRDCTGQYVVVHNGIIENYFELKEMLEKEGHKFVTETDTEVVAHLVEKYAKDLSFEEAVRKTLRELRGIYSLVFLSRKGSTEIDCGAHGTAFGDWIRRRRIFRGERHSCPAGAHARNVLPGGWRHRGAYAGWSARNRPERKSGERPAQHVTWDPIMAEKGGYKHFMQKEIFEQPRAVRDTMLGRISQDTGKVFLDEMGSRKRNCADFDSVRIVACGTSWHAALAGKFMIERLARIPVEVDYGSEFRYRDPIIGCEDADGLHQPIGGNGRHAGGAAGSKAERLTIAGNLQRERFDDHARGGGHDSDACGAGDRRGIDKGVHGAIDGAAAAGIVSGAGAREAAAGIGARS